MSQRRALGRQVRADGDRVRGAAAAALAVGALLLCASACGSPSPPSFHPSGTAAPTPTSSVPLANFPFPPSVHIEFQTPPPSDPQQAAAVTTDRDVQLAFYYAQYTQGKDTRYEHYFAPRTTTLQLQIQRAVLPYATDHKSVRGTLRFYNTTVQPVASAPQELTVSNCIDDSQFPDVDGQSGKPVAGSPSPPPSSYTLESDTFKPLGGGNWGLIGFTTSVYPQGNSKECQS